MRLIIIDNSVIGATQETNEFVKQLGHNSVYVCKNLNDVNQSQYDAVFIALSGDILELPFKIPYFYNINIHSFRSKEEWSFDYFKEKYKHGSAAAAVFVNDKKLNRYCHWMGINSLFTNEGVDIKKYKYIKNRKFFTPKLNIGFIPDYEWIGDSKRNKTILDMWEASKNNWILHIPEDNSLNIDSDRVIKYDCSNGYFNFDYTPIFSNSHIIIEPFDHYKEDRYISRYKNVYEAMSTGCASIMSNQHNNSEDYMFDDIHYIKMDYTDANNLLDCLRYLDKRRDKMLRISKNSSNLIYNYFDIKKIVKQKLEVIKKHI